MAPGLGSRKVLTPKSSKAPRRSLPPQAKLIEAVSFDSIEDVPSSPDIMTQKLQEKVRERKQTNGKSAATTSTNNNNSSTFNQRLAAAATNSLSANAGRSKLSTEEFKLSDDNDESANLSEKYKKNESSGIKNNTNNTGYNSNINSSSYQRPYSTSNNATSNYASNNVTSNYASNNVTSNYNSTAAAPLANKPYTSTSSSNARSYGYPNSTSHNTANTSYNTSYSGPGNSFDRWNSSSNSGNNGPVESIEVLKDQLSHQQRDYDSLKQRFNELSRIRFSEPEEQLEEHKRLSELRDQEGQRVIKSLQKEKEQILEQLKSLKLEVSELKSAKNETETLVKPAEINEQNEFMNEVENILKIYSSFSGLKITSTPTSPLNQWHCEFSSRSGRFEFQLTYESALNRYQYVPLATSNGTSSGTSSIKDLPAFLASDILITSDQMQLFFWRLLDTLSKRKDQ